MVKKLISKKKKKTPNPKKSYVSKVSGTANPQDKSDFNDMWDVVSGTVSNSINDSNYFNSTEDYPMPSDLDNVTFNELEEFISNLPGVITENEEQELLQKAELVFTGDLKELATEVVMNKKSHSKEEEAHNKGHKEEEKANNKKAYNKGHEGEEEEESVEKVAKKEEDVQTKVPSDKVEEEELEEIEDEEENPEEEEEELTMGEARKLLRKNGYQFTGKTKTKMKHNTTEYEVKNGKGKISYMSMADIDHLNKDKHKVDNKVKPEDGESEEEMTTLDEGESKIAFEPHPMFDPKTGKSVQAKNFKEHLKYKKMGWTHKKPTNAQLKKNKCSYSHNDEESEQVVAPRNDSKSTKSKQVCPVGEELMDGKCRVAEMIKKNNKRKKLDLKTMRNK